MCLGGRRTVIRCRAAALGRWGSSAVHTKYPPTHRPSIPHSSPPPPTPSPCFALISVALSITYPVLSSTAILPPFPCSALLSVTHPLLSSFLCPLPFQCLCSTKLLYNPYWLLPDPPPLTDLYYLTATLVCLKLSVVVSPSFEYVLNILSPSQSSTAAQNTSNAEVF